MADIGTGENRPETGLWQPPWQVVEDLHLHSTASDGTMTPEDLVDLAYRNGVRIMALTDHDSVNGLDRAFEAAKKYPDLVVIPGIEMSGHQGDSEAHIVGLFIDRHNEALLAELERISTRREEAIAETVECLAKMGIVVSLDRVRELAKGTIGRPHIARAMQEAGYVQSFKEAFDKYLGSGSPCYKKRNVSSPAQVLKLISEAGGVGIIAHPRTVKDINVVLPDAVKANLAGLEVYAEKYDPDMRRKFAELADKFNLVQCGGSDYHANRNVGEVLPGMVGPPPGTAAALYRRALEIHNAKPGFTWHPFSI